MTTTLMLVLSALLFVHVHVHVAQAQKSVTIKYVHALPPQSDKVYIDKGEGIFETILDPITLEFDPGTKVRILVEEANTYFYEYSIDTTQTVSQLTIPDVSKIAGIFNGVLPKPRNDQNLKTLQHYLEKGSLNEHSSLDSIPGLSKTERLLINKYWHILEYVIDKMTLSPLVSGPEVNTNDLLGNIQILQANLNAAKKLIDSSDDTGLLWVQRVFRNRWLGNFELNNSELENSFKILYEKAKPSQDNPLVEILFVHAKALIMTASQLRTALLSARHAVEFGYIVSENNTTFALQIKQRDTTRETTRRTGKVLTISTSPRFVHSLIELVPISYVVFASDVPEFSIKDSILARRNIEKSDFRLGVALNANLLSFGSSNAFAWNIGAGLSSSYINVKDGLFDFFVYSGISYKKAIRIGIGLGRAIFADKINLPGIEGKPIPANVTDIQTLISNAPKNCWFITFVIPGLNLPVF